MIPDFSEVSEALKDIFILPDAERPYLKLANAYGRLGMKDEKEAVMFLVEKRFRSADADDPDSDEG